ncbi:hypothetical protein ABIB25_000125 [Nakamurella sp. UYEF19]|uniref:DUF998 domain-containing protein n=1 Tax=Nakamurella sp. UYEF19 TaxID=1756392 RepID=UPI003396FBD8
MNTIATRVTPATTTRASWAGDRLTHRLLAAGGLAAPVLLIVGVVQTFTRQGFDLDKHALSMLSLGSMGFIQIANFLVTGALLVAGALGMRRAMPTGPGRTWAPLGLTGFGLGLIVSGVFLADPGYAFPMGTPDGPGQFSWHGQLHMAGFALATIGWLVAAAVLARRFAAQGDRRRAVGCLTAILAAVVIDAAPVFGSFGVRILIVCAIELGLVAAVCVHLIRTPR